MKYILSVVVCCVAVFAVAAVIGSPAQPALAQLPQDEAPAADQQTDQPAETRGETTVEDHGIPAAPPEEPSQPADPVVEEIVNRDEIVEPNQLDVGEQHVLPGNPLYAVKNVWRGLRSATTFGAANKAELKLKFASEKILEAEKLVKKETADPAALNAALENYQADIAELQDRIQKAADLSEKQKEKLAAKLIDHHAKQRRIVDHIFDEASDREDLPGEAAEKILEVKERLNEHLATAPLHLVSPGKMREAFEAAAERQEGSDFKEFKALEVLKDVEQHVPDEAKDAIRKAQETIRQRFEVKLEQLPDEQRGRLVQYTKEIAGNGARHFEILENIVDKGQIPDDVRAAIEKAREEMFKKVETQMKAIHSEKAKGEFLRHLEDADLQDARIVRELEQNLSPETIDSVLAIKNRAMAKMKERFESAQQSDDLESFFAGIEQNHDAEMLAVLDEMGGVVPEDKKEFWQEMRAKAINEMQQDLARVPTPEERQRMMKRFAGEDPEEFGAFQSFLADAPPEFRSTMQEMMNAQMQNMKDRLQQFSDDPERFEFFRARIEDGEFRAEFERRSPSLFGEINEVKLRLRDAVGPEKVAAVLQDARAAIERAEQKLREREAELGEATPFKARMLAEAREHLRRAKEALQQGRHGEALGQATSASHIARNLFRFLEEFTREKEFFFAPEGEDLHRFEELKERFPEKFREFRGEFREEFRHEGPSGEFRGEFRNGTAPEGLSHPEGFPPATVPETGSVPNFFRTIRDSFNGENQQQLFDERARSFEGFQPTDEFLPPPPEEQKSSACPDIVRPVCAAKEGARVSFRNSCEALQAGAEIISEGGCQ